MLRNSPDSSTARAGKNTSSGLGLSASVGYIYSRKRGLAGIRRIRCVMCGIGLSARFERNSSGKLTARIYS